MEPIPNFGKIAENVEMANKIVQNFKRGDYADPKDPHFQKLALWSLRVCCRDALTAANKSEIQLGEV